MNICTYTLLPFVPLQSMRRISPGILRCHRIMAAGNRFSHHLIDYTPPVWAKELNNIPLHKVQLGHLNTPIHRWHLPGVPPEFEVYIKRDDMTGSTLSGNKVRKLEFLFADAVKLNCSHVITCGGAQSNHCRATAVAAAQLGMQCHLVLRAGLDDIGSLGCQGNIFLDRMAGAKMYLVPKLAPFLTHLKPRMDMIASHIELETGENCRLIPVGGSDEVGFYGYLEGFREIIEQAGTEMYDDVVFACGSGGTAEGLSVANYLTGSKMRIHGVAVCDDANYFYTHCNDLLPMVGITDVKSHDILDIVEGYKGKGYGLSTQEELDFILEVSRRTGIVLDPVYTVKAVKGMIDQMNTNPSRFKGRQVLYVHTGGVFGSYDGRIDSSLVQHDNLAERVKLWNDMEASPL